MLHFQKAISMAALAAMASIPSKGDEDAAPRLAVPSERIVAVEHPCIVKNVDKASNMLGGAKAIADTLSHGSKMTLGLKFDPAGKDIVSLNNETDNILLRFTVPKCIGKRKRGSDEPFQPLSANEANEANADAKSILRSMRDNPQGITATPLGVVENSHVFRSIPDFAYAIPPSSFKDEVHTKLFSQDYDTVRQFHLPFDYNPHNTEIFPPPVLSSVSLPQSYSYIDKHSTKAPQGANSEETAMIAVNDLDPDWPATLASTLPSLTSQPKSLRQMVDQLRDLFERRPIWTRRALINNIPQHVAISYLRRALPYTAYYIRNGPWRDTLCRFGVDPRKNPEHGRYQVVQLRIDAIQRQQAGWNRSKNPNDHLYTGTESAQEYDNRLFQLCDISDPLLSPLIRQTNRGECDPIHYGWYQNGTFSKIPILLRAKLHASLQTNPLSEVDAAAAVAALPEHFDFVLGETHPSTDNNPAYPPETASEVLKNLSTEYRHTIRAAENKRKKRLEEIATNPAGPVDATSASTTPDVVDPPLSLFESAWNAAD